MRKRGYFLIFVLFLLIFSISTVSAYSFDWANPCSWLPFLCTYDQKITGMATVGETCSPTGSNACASDGNTQLYCNPSNSQWQFSQYCSTSSRTCDSSSGMCKAICGDGICGTYETASDCPGYTDCGTTCGIQTCSSTQWCANSATGICCANGAYYCNGQCSSVACGTLSTCSEGVIPSSGCQCGGLDKYSGYCCSNVYVTSACTTSTTCGSTTCGSSSWCANSATSTCCANGAYYCNGQCSSVSCSTTNTTTSSCLSSQLGSCYTSSSCSSVGGYWCNNYCQSSQCPTCSSSQTWNCYSQSNCTNAGGFWCNNYCQSSSCPTYSCSLTEYWNCNNQTSCTNAGAKWCGTYCSNSCPVCESSNLWNCYTSSDCSSKGGFWCITSATSPGYCQTSSCPTCSSSQVWNCYTQSDCTSKGGKWCGTYCSDNCPICSSSQPSNCRTQAECNSANGKWCGTWCSDSCPTCSSTNIWNCYTQADCTSATGKWCNTGSATSTGYCQTSDCPTCKAGSIWNCYTQTSCNSANGKWCGTWCSDSCPTCSSSQQWNCNTQSDCTNTGGYWCNNYCQSSQCPTCSSSQKWNCYSESECTTSGGKWCKNQEMYSTTTTGTTGWCTDYTCPYCSSTNKASCNSELSCKNANGKWCGTWCDDKCPTVCGNNVCDAGETTSSCPTDCKSASCPTTISASTGGKSTFNLKETINLIITSSPNTAISAYSPLSGGFSILTDSSGKYEKNIIVNDNMPRGDHTFNFETKTPNCPAVSTSLSFKIEGTTRAYEDIVKCFPTRTCPDGKTVGCKDINSFCSCESCSLSQESIPPGCTQAISSNGYVTVTCQSSCPPPSADMKQKEKSCIEGGGSPKYRTDEKGCSYFDCAFASDPNFLKTYDKCFTEKELEGMEGKCKQMGLPLSVKLAGDCKVASCGQEKVRKSCPMITSEEKNNIQAGCALEGLKAMPDYNNETGCKILKCKSPTDCVKEPPQSVYDDCNQKGGEVIVKADADNCITYTECISRGDSRDIAIEDINVMPSTTDLLFVSLRLESLRVEILKMKALSQEIADYYKSQDMPEAKRWERIPPMFDSVIQSIDDTKQKILLNQDELTKSDLIEIKQNIKRTLDGTLRDIIYLILSSKDDLTKIETGELKDCGSDSQCFNSAFTICQPVTFTPSGTIVQIKGIEDGLCILTAQTTINDGASYDMTCKISNYALGAENPQQSIFPYCEGTMVDMIKQQTTATPQQLSEPIQEPPREVEQNATQS